MHTCRELSRGRPLYFLRAERNGIRPKFLAESANKLHHFVYRSLSFLCAHTSAPITSKREREREREREGEEEVFTASRAVRPTAVGTLRLVEDRAKRKTLTTKQIFAIPTKETEPKAGVS